MKRSLLFVCVVGLATAPLSSPASAQESLLQACSEMNPVFVPNLPVGQEREQLEEQFRYLCGQVVHTLTNVQPTVGIAFSGGNHTLGTASTIGRRLGFFPRIAVTGRINAALAEVPDLLDGYTPEYDDQGELQPIGTVFVPVPTLAGDVTVGLFNGFSVGPLFSGLGSVDLLGSVSFIPAVEQAGLENPILSWGAGARVGILRQGLLLPGVSVSGMYRNLPSVGFGEIDRSNFSAGDPAEFSTDLSTLSFRAAVSKGLLALDFAAGLGYDIYRSDIRFDWVLDCPSPDPCTVPTRVHPEEVLEGRLETAAWNVFGNVGLSLVLLNLVGEVGYQKATDVLTADDLRDAGLPDRALTVDDLGGGRFFASIGLRLTL